MKDFKDKIAVVTGAASGIGRGMAEVFIEAGMKVVMADVDETNLNTTVSALNDAVSKHAVVALTESLHLELMMQGANIKVSLLCPGIVNTDIMESSLRNRPADVPPPPDRPAEEAVFVEAYKTWVARGLDPKMVGQQVLGAIKEERLYVVTTNDFDEHIQQRMTSILDRKNLGLSEPPESLMDILKEIVG